MADVIDTKNIEANGETGAQPTTAVVKKTRAPRRPKNAVGAAVNAGEAVADKPAKKTRAKRGTGVAVDKAAKVAKTSRVAKGSGVITKPKAAATAAVTDELVDLLALEEENKNLRKQLSEKLRAENADLRKRLGQN